MILQQLLRNWHKNLVLDTTGADIKETLQILYRFVVQLLESGQNIWLSFYRYLVKLAKGDKQFTGSTCFHVYYEIWFYHRYGADDICRGTSAVRSSSERIYRPQKPMKVEPGIYPLNGADENSLVVTTVDFALTYFVVSGELERSGVPLNLVINDAGGLSVLTSWAAGKFSGNSISEYIKENVEPKVKCRRLVIPGKVAVLKAILRLSFLDGRSS